MAPRNFLPFACLILEGTSVHCLFSQVWVACVEIHDSWVAYGWLCDFLMCLTSFLEPDGWANESTIDLKVCSFILVDLHLVYAGCRGKSLCFVVVTRSSGIYRSRIFRYHISFINVL